MTFEVGVVHKRHPHLLSDLAELLLVVSYDGLTEVSQARLEALMKEIPVSADELFDEEEEQGDHAVDKIESTDRHVEDCWGQLEYRAGVVGEFYPFQIEGPILKWKDDAWTPLHFLYCFLLLCSRLRSFLKIAGFAQRAAAEFAHISKLALEQLSGVHSAVRIFDANSEDRQNHYGTNLRDAMRKLATDLGAHYVIDEAINQLPTSGDYGLDLVAAHPFSDGAKGTLAIFGQCGARETDWPSKTLEAHPVRFSGLFSLLSEPANVMFIPLSYRDSSGGWVAGYKLAGCLLIDRIRILRLISQRWDTALPLVEERCVPIVNEIINPA